MVAAVMVVEWVSLLVVFVGVTGCMAQMVWEWRGTGGYWWVAWWKGVLVVF